jgi:hypothetical protein
MNLRAWPAVLLAASFALAQSPPQGGITLEDPDITESSGVVASRLAGGIYWTHNDSGDGPYLYAFDLQGRSHGRWTVPGAQNVDWEDIAIGPGPRAGRPYLYVGDIGDNNRTRKEIVVYRIEEPRAGERSACAGGCRTGPATVFRLRYPDGPHNAETLLVHPVSGDLYVISKASSGDPPTTVYVARARQLRPGAVALRALATLDIPDPLFRTFIGGLTGGDISPDGRRLVLCDYFRMYEAVLPEGARFDEIWGRRFSWKLIGIGLQVEGICYRPDGQAVIATSEGKPCPLFEIPIED